MHAIARHGLVSLFAFGLSRLIGLAIVGLVVGEYGLAIIGLLMLVRVLAPGQLLAPFHLALPELVIRATARGLVTEGAREAVSLFMAALLVVSSIGFVLGLPLLLFPEAVAKLLFNLEALDVALLAPAVIAHGVAMAMLFAGAVSGAGLKGQEAFRHLRSIDVGTTLAHGLAAGIGLTGDAAPPSLLPE